MAHKNDVVNDFRHYAIWLGYIKSIYELAHTFPAFRFPFFIYPAPSWPRFSSFLIKRISIPATTPHWRHYNIPILLLCWIVGYIMACGTHNSNFNFTSVFVSYGRLKIIIFIEEFCRMFFCLSWSFHNLRDFF